ncbi:MAG: copper amine oxidase N-terminal domain-containing protein [Mycobacterium leprae]
MANPLKIAAMHWSYPSVHGVRIQIPWDTNEPQYGKYHFAFSKGSRQQIIAYTEANCPNITRWQIEAWMKGENPQEIHVGIDCSGFVYRMLEEACVLSDATPLADSLGKTCEYAWLDMLTPANQVINRADEVQAGDTMRFNWGKHSGVIIETVTDPGGVLREIWYAHSSYTRGPHIGWIEVTDPSAPIKATCQNWHDDMWDHLTNNMLRDLYFTSVHHSPFYKGLRPKVVKRTGIVVTINGQAVAFDQPAFVLNGHTFCQLRPLAEALGATVGWQQSAQMATVKRGSRTASCQVGSEVAVVNGRGMLLDEPPIFAGPSVMVPARFLAEALGFDVLWDQANGRVDILWT